MRSYRSFSVQVRAGLAVAGWPFGRIDVGDSELAVRSFLFPSVRRRSVRKESVVRVYAYKRMGRHRLKVDDTDGAFSNVSVSLIMQRQGVIDELRLRGYPVVLESPPLFGAGRR
ncbi:MAG TPA: hypothetical protein VH637_15285 [Streptosporangiaceae bacterium]